MLVQLNTDHHVHGSPELAEDVTAVVTQALGHLADRVSRVEVHLRDENADKGGVADKRCVMEARVEGMRPVTITHDAGNMHDAIHGAATKIKRTLEKTLGKLEDR